MSDQPVAVVGAGIVGVCCALWLQQSGRKVILFDGAEPGSGTSSGNACTIANYGCVPVNNPAIPRQLPSLLFSSDSPLSIDLLHAAAHPGWVISFLKHCRASEVSRIISALGSLLRQTHDGLDPLVTAAGADDLFKQNGCLYVYATKAAYDAATPYNQARAENGVHFETLDNAEIRDLEPQLQMDFHRGLLFSNARQTVNPQTLVQRLFQHFIASAGQFRQAKVVETAADGEWIKLTDGEKISVSKVVIAAGAFSRQLKNAGTARLPLQTERGYHVQFAGYESMLSRPVGWAEAGLYATPMDRGLRFAGTVEIAGLNRPVNQRSLNYLRKRARQMMAIDQPPSQTWLGFRPTLPDSLPVIGHHQHSPNLIYAFGHQHIGLTLAGITGKLVSEIVSGVPTCVDIDPFSPHRFSS